MKPSTNLKLNSFTCLAFLINRVIDVGPDTDLSYEEIFDAASERRLIPLLADRYGQNNAFTFYRPSGPTLGLAPAPAQPFLPCRSGNGLPQPGAGLHGACPPLRQVCPSAMIKDEPVLAEPPRGNHAQPGLTLSAFLQLAFIVNSLADSPSETDLPFCEVHAAARQGRFLQLLGEYSGRFPDFSFLQSPSGCFQELGIALRAASAALESREFVTAGVYQNGYCLALALVLEAMRQKFPAHLTTSE